MKKIVTILLIAAIAWAGWSVVTHHSPISIPGRQKTTSIDKKQFSLRDPASLWVVVNKQRPLEPLAYRPADLVNPTIPLMSAETNEEMMVRADVAKALEKMANEASKSGLKLMLASGFRSYERQAATYNSEVQGFGQEVADKESARPGYSEHQTGLAADLEPESGTCEVQLCFADTPEGKWLAANAYKYGFIMRYPADKTAITGYQYEPWHVRYVGTDLPNAMHQQGTKTLEEFFNLPSAPNY